MYYLMFIKIQKFTQNINAQWLLFINRILVFFQNFNINKQYYYILLNVYKNPSAPDPVDNSFPFIVKFSTSSDVITET